MKKLIYWWLRRRFRAQARSTRFGIAAGSLDAMRKEIEQNHEWAHASPPSFRDSWKRFWLWLWLRRRIQKAPPTPPYMKKVGPRKWVEVPPAINEEAPAGMRTIRPECIADAIPKDYWKTHEPVFTPKPKDGTVYWPQFVSANEALAAEVAERNLKADSSECCSATDPGPVLDRPSVCPTQDS